MCGCFLLHNTTHHYRALYQVVAEKSLAEKSLQTDKQTNIVTEKGKNYIPPIYFVRGV